jgi:hypothetical protein
MRTERQAAPAHPSPAEARAVEPGTSKALYAAAPRADEPPGVVLPLAEAAWAAGLSRSALTEAVQQGRIPVRRLVVAGRAVAAVALRDLEGMSRDREAQHAARSAEHELEAARLRETVARMEGELETSARVERSVQRYADRLEQRMAKDVGRLEAELAEAHKRELTLARALGAAEARLELAQGREQEELPELPDFTASADVAPGGGEF